MRAPGWVGAMTCAAAILAATPPAFAADPLPPNVIAPGVSIDGVAVGGLTIEAARRAVIDARIAPRYAPLVLTLAGRRMAIKPASAGYVVDLDQAIDLALGYGRVTPLAAPVDVPLPQDVDRARLREVLAYRAADVELAPVDAKLMFKRARPRVRPPRIGTLVNVAKSVPLVATAMLTRATPQVTLVARRVRPAKMKVGASVVVSRRARVLSLYREAKLVKTFRIAVGTPSYPTPRGLFSIVTKQRNPTWIPPDSPWAKGLGPIPPGPGNPLGTRWMGTSASAVGIHGTPASGSIGTAASHGCIRMYVRDSEWLYERIAVGTPVLIV